MPLIVYTSAYCLMLGCSTERCGGTFHALKRVARGVFSFRLTTGVAAVWRSLLSAGGRFYCVSFDLISDGGAAGACRSRWVFFSEAREICARPNVRRRGKKFPGVAHALLARILNAVEPTPCREGFSSPS